MYCPKCGKKCSDNAKFCAYCGAKIRTIQNADDIPEKNSENNIQPDGENDSKGGDGDFAEKFRKMKKWPLWVILGAAACVVVIVSVFSVRNNNSDRQYRNRLEAGYAYMEEGKYEEAVAEFNSAIRIDPKEIEPYQQLAEAYAELDDTEMAESTYDDARSEILAVYEDQNSAGSSSEDIELPDGAEDLYIAAINYYGENGDLDTVEELTEEITSMLPEDEEGIREIEEVSLKYLNADQAKTESELAESAGEQSEEPVEELSEESVEELLDLFPYMANELLYEWYTGFGSDVLEDEEISSDQAYRLAALATFESDEYNDYMEGEDRELKNINGELYSVLPTELYEKYLRNMFGDEYSISDFTDQDGYIIRDSDGTFYREIGDYGDVGDLEVTVESISETPDEDGIYDVLVKYNVHTFDDTYIERYMLYRLRPDESSDYGCAIVEMDPAGDGEIDEEYLLQMNEHSEFTSGEWQDMYRAYITDSLLVYDTDRGANVRYQLEPEGTYTFALIYLNDDEIPELLVYNDSSELTTYNHYAYELFTIQDDMLKSVSYGTAPLQNFSYIERSSLFFESYVQDGDMFDTVGRMLDHETAWQTNSEDVYILCFLVENNVYRMNYGLTETGENAFSVENIDLTEAEYENHKSQLNAYLEENNAITPTMVTKEELLEKLESY